MTLTTALLAPHIKTAQNRPAAMVVLLGLFRTLANIINGFQTHLNGRPFPLKTGSYSIPRCRGMSLSCSKRTNASSANRAKP
jgi:hypothetical protein